jgi:hypothetical protein
MGLLRIDNKTGTFRSAAVPAKGRLRSGAPAVVLDHPCGAVCAGTKRTRARERARRWVLRELDCLLQQRGLAAIERKSDCCREIE